MDRPRVLLDATILNTDTRTRGVGRYVADLVRGLGSLSSKANVDVTYLIRLDRWGRAHLTRDATHLLKTLRSAPEMTYTDWAYRGRIWTARACRKAGAQLLHVPHTFHTPLFDVRATRLVTCHDLVPLRFPAHYVSYKEGFLIGRRLLDARRVGRADHILPISRATASDLRRMLQVPADKMTVVPLGVDNTWPTRPRRDRPRASSAPFVLYVGSADWRKNARGMLRAVAEARRSGIDVELVWAGRLGPARQRNLAQTARRLGAAVRFVGYVDDDILRGLYREAVATVFCSFAEGFGYPVVEAMASGCPVITSDCSATKEVAGDAAWLVDPSDPSAIASAVMTLARDRKQRAELRRRGIARARAFTTARMASETLTVYERLVGDVNSRDRALKARHAWPLPVRG